MDDVYRVGGGGRRVVFGWLTPAVTFSVVIVDQSIPVSGCVRSVLQPVEVSRTSWCSLQQLQLSTWIS